MARVEAVSRLDGGAKDDDRRRHKRLKAIARAAWWVSVVAGGLIVVCEAYLASAPDAMLSGEALAPYAADAVLGPGRLTALWLINVVPAGLFVAAMANAAALFGHIGRGAIFHPVLPVRLGWLGSLAIASAFAEMLAGTASVAVVSASRPQHQLVIGLAISSQELSLLVLGLLIAALALIMREALLIDADNRSIV